MVPIHTVMQCTDILYSTGSMCYSSVTLKCIQVTSQITEQDSKLLNDFMRTQQLTYRTGTRRGAGVQCNGQINCLHAQY